MRPITSTSVFEKAQVEFWMGVNARAVVSAMTVRLSVRIWTRPRIVVIVPSVTMKALMPTYWTSAPLIRPKPRPTRNTSAIVPGAPTRSRTSIVMAPANAATDPTDRSKLPVIRSMVIATATMPVQAVWSRTFATFVGFR